MNKEQILLGMKIYSENGIDFILGEEEQRILLDYIEELKQENQKLKIQISEREEVANKYKEVIDKMQKEINEEYSIMGVKVVENYILEDILKEVE